MEACRFNLVTRLKKRENTIRRLQIERRVQHKKNIAEMKGKDRVLTDEIKRNDRYLISEIRRNDRNLTVTSRLRENLQAMSKERKQDVVKLIRRARKPDVKADTSRENSTARKRTSTVHTLNKTFS